MSSRGYIRPSRIKSCKFGFWGYFVYSCYVQLLSANYYRENKSKISRNSNLKLTLFPRSINRRYQRAKRKVKSNDRERSLNLSETPYSRSIKHPPRLVFSAAGRSKKSWVDGRVCRAERKEDKYLHGRQRRGTREWGALLKDTREESRRTLLFVSTLTQ